MAIIAVCDKCGGHGYLERFSHIENGKCFRCDGTGQVEVADEDWNEAMIRRREENAKRFEAKLENWKPKEIPLSEIDFLLPY